MWNCNYEAIKVCCNHSRVVLANQRIFKFKNSIYKAKFNFLFQRNYASVFLTKGQKHRLIPYFFLHSMRKMQFESRSQKLVYKPVTEKEEKVLSHSYIIKSLQNCTSIEEQIKVFHSIVKLSTDDIKLRQNICKDLEKALQSYFLSTVAVYLIGSSINGLGFKGCDVDLTLCFLTVDMNEHLKGEKSLSSNKEEKIAVTKVHSAKSQLLTVRKILQEAKFKEPLTVIPGRCPILNFSHHKLACDLSVNNRLAVHSTNLMLLCGKLDERVTPLLQVIIYWAKSCKLVGGPGKFKTYAIFLLVIYFLQTRHPPILPSIETMLQKTEFSKNLDNWSYDVTKYLSEFDKSLNHQTTEELLREFFMFYGNYDFSHIICPLIGCSVERMQFLKKINHDDNFVLNTLCIQDPLKLSWNVTTGVSWKHCKNFLKAVIMAWEKCQQPDMWDLNPDGTLWGVSSLVGYKYDLDGLCNIREFSIKLSPKRQTLAPHEEFRCVLNHCLDFECYPLEDLQVHDLPHCVRSVVEKQLLKGETDLSGMEGDIRLLAQYVFKASDTWLGRNTYTTTLRQDVMEDLFTYEQRISDLMRKQRQNKESSDEFYFLCQCYSSEGKQCLHVHFRPLNTDKLIPKLMIFLKEYLPRMMGEEKKSIPSE